MATVTTPVPGSIPKRVFYGLVKELVQNESEEPHRVSGQAVKLLQLTTEDYISNIFAKTETVDNKILNVEIFQEARKRHDYEEEQCLATSVGDKKTILTYDDETDVLF